MNDWSLFLLTALAIIVAGSFISWLSDAIAKKTDLGGLWIGLVLVALVTSLPEITTAASAGSMGFPNLSAGDLFGSGIFNLAILAFADMIHRQKRLLQSITLGHVVTGGLSMILTALAAIFIMVKAGVAIGWVSWGSIIIIIVYIYGIWLATRDNHKTASKELDRQAEKLEKGVSKRILEQRLSVLIVGIFATAVTIFIAAPLMASSANQIAVTTGIDDSFFGTFFIALITSLPELVVSITAIKMGAFDLIVGNIFGSNAFNMVGIFVLDLFFIKGSVFQNISSIHVVTALFIITITTIAIIGLVFRSEKRYALLEPDATLILLLSIAAFYVVWRIN